MFDLDAVGPIIVTVREENLFNIQLAKYIYPKKSKINPSWTRTVSVIHLYPSIDNCLSVYVHDVYGTDLGCRSSSSAALISSLAAISGELTC